MTISLSNTTMKSIREIEDAYRATIPYSVIGTITYHTPYRESYDCDVILSHYPNGQHCLELIDTTYGQPVACASKPLDLTGAISDKFLNATLANHCVAIKDHSENAGILKQLISADIVLPPTIHVGGVFSRVYICELVCMKVTNKIGN